MINFNEENWKNGVKKAYEQAVKIISKRHSCRRTNCYFRSWLAGILLHEAIGHGLEGDFNRKTSAFHDLVEKVASEQISVVDDGTINDKRGSLTIDDEGTPSQNTMLIENGILKGFMQDRLNASLMNQSSTGNGRRQVLPFTHAKNDQYLHA